MKSMRKTLSALAILSLPATAHAAGFAVYEHAAKPTARLGAFTATADDPSAVFYNPAGLTNIEGGQILVGITLIRPTATYVGPGVAATRPAGVDSVEQSTEGTFLPVPALFYGRQLSEKAYIGFGIYAPYGLKLSWETGGEPFTGRTVLQTIDLRNIFFTPAIALKLTDEISVALEVNLVAGTVYLKRVLGADDNLQPLFPAADPSQEGVAELSGNAFGVGAGAGVQLKLLDNLRLGLTYRTQIDMDFAGDVDFTLPANTPTAIQANFPDGPVSAPIHLPHSFALGIGWVDGPLVVEAGVNLTLWTSIEELLINFESGLPAPRTTTPRDWNTVPTFRLGGEYAFGEYVARAGIGYDVNAVPDRTVDPTLPDADRFLFSVGGGAKFGPVDFDLAYMGVIIGEREANESVNFPQGTYKSNVIHLIGASIGFRM
jgi:long-chain fatty acid transport protein